jgi:hypothetical protein
VAQGRCSGSGLIAGLLTAIVVHVKVFGGQSLAPGVRYWGARPQVNQSRRRRVVSRDRKTQVQLAEGRTLELPVHSRAPPDRHTDSQVSLSHSSTFFPIFTLLHTQTSSSSSSILTLPHSLNPLCKSVSASCMPLAARISGGLRELLPLEEAPKLASRQHLRFLNTQLFLNYSPRPC